MAVVAMSAGRRTCRVGTSPGARAGAVRRGLPAMLAELSPQLQVAPSSADVLSGARDRAETTATSTFALPRLRFGQDGQQLPQGPPGSEQPGSLCDNSELLQIANASGGAYSTSVTCSGSPRR